MRLVISTISTLGLAALLMACGGSQKEDTTPASTEAAPAEGEESAPAEEGAPAGDQDEDQAPAEEGAAGGEEQPAGGGW
jgi:hypothetical protein